MRPTTTRLVQPFATCRRRAITPVILIAVVTSFASAQSARETARNAQLGTAQPANSPSPSESRSLIATRLFARSIDLQNNEQWPQATMSWQTFLREYPHAETARQARGYLGVCLLQQEKYDAAAAELSRLIQENSDDDIADEAHLNLSICYYSKGFQEDRDALIKAAKLFSAHLKKYPKSNYRDQSWYYFGECLSMLGYHEKAASVYRELISQHPASHLRSVAMRALAASQLDQGQTGDARATFTRLAQEYKDHDAAGERDLLEAEQHWDAGDWQSASDGFRAVATSNRDSADFAQLRYALCLERAEQFAQAAEAYVELKQRFPHSEFGPDALLGAGRAFALSHDAPNARRMLAQVPADNPNLCMEAAHWRCRLELFEGNYLAAQEIAEAALAGSEEAEGRVEVTLDLAEALARHPSKQMLAIAKYIEAAKGQPDGELLWRAMLGTADCLLHVGRYAQAEQIANQFLSAHEDNEHRPAFEYVLAESARRQAMHEQAQSDLLSLLDKHPQHPMVTTWKVRLAGSLNETRDYQRAFDVLNETDIDSLNDRMQREARRQREISLRALRALNDRAQASPRELQLFEMSRQAVDQGDLAAAMLHTKTLISEFADSLLIAETLLSIAEAYYAADEFEQAEQIYQQTTEQVAETATYESALYKLGWSQLQQGKAATALGTFAELIKMNAHSEWAQDARYMHAQCLVRLGRYQHAVAELAPLREHPDLPPHLLPRVLLDGARCWQEAGEWRASLVWLRELMTVDSQIDLRPEARRLTNYALAHLSQPSGARAAERLATEPADPGAQRQ